MKLPKTQFNFRLDELTADLLRRLADHMAMSQTDVVIQSIRRMAERELKKSRKNSEKEVDNV